MTELTWKEKGKFSELYCLPGYMGKGNRASESKAHISAVADLGFLDWEFNSIRIAQCTELFRIGIGVTRKTGKHLMTGKRRKTPEKT